MTTTAAGLPSEKHRFLHGPGTDQILAVEDLTDIFDTGRWILPDHQGTVRDVIEYDGATSSTLLDHHRTYDTFGNVTEYDSSGNFVRVFASSNLNDTHALVFGPNGNMFASAFGNTRVHEYDGVTGAFIGTFVGQGNGLSSAHGMIFHDDLFYVTSFGSDRVNEHDAVTGAFIRAFVTPGLGGLDGAISITFMPDPPSLNPYGCGVNPGNSLTVISGTPADWLINATPACSRTRTSASSSASVSSSSAEAASRLPKPPGIPSKAERRTV